MPLFKYVATDYTGQKIRGQIDAKDRSSVVSSLRKSRLMVISVSEVRERDKTAFGRSGKVKLEDLVVFSRQLSALVKAGVSLVKGLNILFSQVENKALRDIIASIITKIESGSSLSDALANYPQVFSPFFINMVRAGEFSGALDEILDRLALYLESVSKLNRKVRAAFVYPTAIVSVAVLITSLIFTFVIPKFKDIFDTLGVKLPLATQIVVNFSLWFKKYFIFIPIMIIVCIAVLKWLLRTPQLRLAQDGLKLRLIVVGKILRKVAIARFSRTLATLLKSGVSILAALEIASKTSGNMVVEKALNRVINQVSKGERIGASLAENKIFTPLVISLVAVGEETGDISTMLDKVASFYEDEIDNAIAGLTSLIEPFIILFLGVFIGGIVLSIFLPILQLTRVVGH